MKQDWEKAREGLKYYKKSLEIIENIKNKYNCKSIVDIGGWAGNFVGKTSLNKKTCLDWWRRTDTKTPEDVKLIIEDFLTWEIERHDIACCMQVLEHMPDEYVEEFAKKLFHVAPHVIISVPYKWRAGMCKYHKQDPVDKYKLKKWVGREPNFCYIVKDGMAERLVCYYGIS
ncbi:hypothetical protein CMI37_32435 [Candidatus Pacearchaeota archaeon]|nr:hypothetical protein [Candidatus Pacearchaeota archaeon]|tara:strand:- start:1138 stop:1653 length:516 start_codon:yes stop_codon:yes gene_type:complete